jgi:hypothetical protein
VNDLAVEVEPDRYHDEGYREGCRTRPERQQDGTEEDASTKMLHDVASTKITRLKTSGIGRLQHLKT